MKKIIEKWYKKLNFPTEFDKDFQLLLNTVTLPLITVKEYKNENFNAQENLLLFLYFCEALEEKYREYGIAEEILLDTLGDIVIWTKTHKKMTDELGLSEIDWLKRHLSFRLFKLGRLQFCFGETMSDLFEIEKGSPILEIHIPAVGPMDTDECEKSIKRAGEFFAEYFPDYKYLGFTCYSWLLDPTLTKFLKDSSNILKFQKLFKVEKESSPSFDALKFIFAWDIKKEELKKYPANNDFTKKIKEYVLSGNDLFMGYGLIK